VPRSLALLALASFRPARLHLAAVVAFGAVAQCLALALPLYLIHFVDRALPARDATALPLVLAALALVLAAVVVLDGVRRLVASRTAAWIDRHLAATRVTAALREAWRRGSGATVTADDLADLRREFRGPAPRALLDLPWAVIAAALLVLLHPMAGATAAGSAVVLLSATVIAFRRVRRLESARAASPLPDPAAGLLRPTEAAAAMAMHRDLAGQWSARRQASLDAADQLDRADDWNAIVGHLGLLAGTMGVIAVASWLAVSGRMTGGEAIAAFVLAYRVLAPFADAMRHARALARLQQVLGQLRAALATEPSSPAAQSHRLPRGPLVIEEMWYRMPGGRGPALQRVSFRAEPGEAIAIVGANASGKSTLARLVAGLLEPDAGRIAIGPSEVSRLAPDVRAAVIGCVPQSFDLYPGTVGENIRRMASGPVDATEAAARAAGAHELILALPEGYATDVGAAGMRLSASQRQRVALARALYGAPSLLILDEPGACLDDDGRAALDAAIGAAKARGAIVVLVARSAEIPESIDHVYRLDKGQVEIDPARSRPRHDTAAAATGHAPAGCDDAVVEETDVELATGDAPEGLAAPGGSPDRSAA